MTEFYNSTPSPETFLMHFNKNHDKSNGRFTSGPGGVSTSSKPKNQVSKEDQDEINRRKSRNKKIAAGVIAGLAVGSLIAYHQYSKKQNRNMTDVYKRMDTVNDVQISNLNKAIEEQSRIVNRSSKQADEALAIFIRNAHKDPINVLGMDPINVPRKYGGLR